MFLTREDALVARETAKTVISCHYLHVLCCNGSFQISFFIFYELRQCFWKVLFLLSF